MSLKKDRKASSAFRDLKLARFLSRILNKLDKGKVEDTECPSSEDIAAFIDGQLSPKEREGIIGHLNRCNGCYGLFSETLETKREMEREVIRGTARPLWKRVIPYAIAASLVFMLVYALYYPWMRGHHKKDLVMDTLAFPLMAQKIDLLGKDVQGEPSQFFFNGYRDTGYGFGGSGLSIRNRLFLFGVYQTDLELSLIERDREKALAIIMAINSMLKPVDQSDRIIRFYNELKQKVEKHTPLSLLLGTMDKICFTDPGLILYSRFGQWAEAGRIASLTMNNKVLKAEEAGFFMDKLRDEALPQGVERSLETVKTILEKGALEEGDFKRMEREFTNIILISF